MPILRQATKALALGGTCITAITIAGITYQETKRSQSKSALPKNKLYSFKQKAQTDNKKNVVVIGGGVVGITAAYKLASEGHSVVVLEPRSKPGKECSACAAGGMQRNNPVVDRGTWIAVTKSFLPFTRCILGGEAESYKFFHIDWLSSITDPFYLRWSATFAKTSLFPKTEQQHLQKHLLLFTDYAVSDMVKMMQDRKDPMAQKTGYNASGGLSLSYDAPVETNSGNNKVEEAHPTSSRTFEPSKQLLGDDITIQEPCILHQKKQPTSAKFEYEAKASSSERFTEELAERCVNDPKLDVTFFYNTSIQDIDAASAAEGKRKVTTLHTNNGVIDVSDATCVVAAGAWTPKIMALIDLYAPVYPLKGYAMSINAEKVLQSNKTLGAKDLPTRIVADKYMYTSRLGDEIRITSIGEFSGWSTLPTASVEKEFRSEAKRQFPQLGSFIDNASVRCGHRPYVSDGILLLGRVDSFDNLLVSCGPGSNGWKLAMGSGEIVEKLISGLTEDDISEELGFDANSFSPKGRVVASPIFSKICRARWGFGEMNG